MTLDETDIERISPTIRRTEVRIVSTPPHSWVRSSNLSSRVYVSIFLRKKGRRNLILHGGSIRLVLVLVVITSLKLKLLLLLLLLLLLAATL